MCFCGITTYRFGSPANVELDYLPIASRFLLLNKEALVLIPITYNSFRYVALNQELKTACVDNNDSPCASAFPLKEHADTKLQSASVVLLTADNSCHPHIRLQAHQQTPDSFTWFHYNSCADRAHSGLWEKTSCWMDQQQPAKCMGMPYRLSAGCQEVVESLLHPAEEEQLCQQSGELWYRRGAQSYTGRKTVLYRLGLTNYCADSIWLQWVTVCSQ